MWHNNAIVFSRILILITVNQQNALKFKISYIGKCGTSKVMWSFSINITLALG